MCQFHKPVACCMMIKTVSDSYLLVQNTKNQRCFVPAQNNMPWSWRVLPSQC